MFGDITFRADTITQLQTCYQLTNQLSNAMRVGQADHVSNLVWVRFSCCPSARVFGSIRVDFARNTLSVTRFSRL